MLCKQYIPSAESVTSGSEYDGDYDSRNAEDGRLDDAEERRQTLNAVAEMTFHVADVGVARRRDVAGRPVIPGGGGGGVEHGGRDPVECVLLRDDVHRKLAEAMRRQHRLDEEPPTALPVPDPPTQPAAAPRLVAVRLVVRLQHVRVGDVHFR